MRGAWKLDTPTTMRNGTAVHIVSIGWQLYCVNAVGLRKIHATLIV